MINLLIALFTFKVMAADLNQLNAVSFEEVNKVPTLTFIFEQAVNLDNVEARFIRRTVEWDMAGTKLKKDKLFINVSKADIDNVYVSHNDDNSVRVRVNMDTGKMASNYHERIQYSTDGKKLQLKWDPSVPLITNNIKEINRVYTFAAAEPAKMDAKSEEHLTSVSRMKVGDAKSAVASDSTQAGSDDANKAEDEIDLNAPENEIPLTAKKAKAAAASAPSLKRMAGGFFVLAVLLISAMYVTRRMKQKNAGKAINADSITVVSQKYLGPKRNLVLVRVTGEYLLLGVTDHNISLIKNLNVVDDEIPELSGNKNFNEVLDKKGKVAEDYAAANDIENDGGFSVSSLDDVKKIFKKKRYIDEVDF